MLRLFEPDKNAPATKPAEQPGILDRLHGVLAKLENQPDPVKAQALRRIIHSPFAALAVQLTPSPGDDFALEVLKALFPAA